MKPAHILVISFALLCLSQGRVDSQVGEATQTGGSAGGPNARHVVYGDLKVEEGPVGTAEVHLRLGQLHGVAGYGELAAKEYEQYLEKKPDSPRRADVEKVLKELKK